MIVQRARRVGTLVGVALRGRATTELLGILAVLVVAASALVAGRAMRQGGSDALDNAAGLAAAPDLVLWGKSDVLRKVAGERPVRASHGPFALSSAETVGSRGETELVLVSELPGGVSGARPMPPVGRLILRAGRFPRDHDPREPAEVMVEPGMSRIDEHVRIRYLGATHSARVVGIAVDLGACGSPTCRPGRAFVTRSRFVAMFGTIDGQRDSSIALALEPRTDAVALAAHLTNTNPGAVHRTFTWTSTRAQLLRPDWYLGTFVTGFGVFLLAVAMIVAAGAISARMAARRRELGVLDALGAGPVATAASVVLEHVLLGIVASVIGWMLGSIAAVASRAGVARAIGWGGVQLRPNDLWVACTIVTVLMALSTIGASWRAARLATTHALRDEIISGRPRARWLLRLPGTTLPLGLQDPITRPVRSTVALLAVAFAIAGSVASLGLLRTVENLTAPNGRIGERWDVSLWSMDGRPTESLAPLVESVRGVAATFTSRADSAEAIDLSTPPDRSDRPVVARATDRRSFMAIAQGGRFDVTAVRLAEGRAPHVPDEAIAADALLRTNHLSIGDRFRFRVAGAALTVRIVGRYHDAQHDGLALRYRLEHLRAARPTASSGSLQVLGEPSTTSRDLLVRIQAAIGPRAQAHSSRGLAGEASAVRIAILVLTALVLLVSLAQLGASWLAGAREQFRDLAILTATGMSRAQLVGRAAVGAAATSVGAAMVGLVLGTIAAAQIAGRATRRLGLSEEIVLGVSPVHMSVVTVAVSAVAVGLACLAVLGVTRTAPARHLRWE